MLDDLRNLFGDMLSGKIKDTQIALTKQESDMLRLKVDGLLDKVRTFEEERVPLITKLEEMRLQLANKDSLIADLEAKLAERDRGPDRLPEKQEEILKLLHHSESLSVEQIADSIGLSAPDTKFHMDKLSEGEFIRFDLNKAVSMNRMIRSSPLVRARGGYSGNAPKSLGAYYIKAKGREYVVTKLG